MSRTEDVLSREPLSDLEEAATWLIRRLVIPYRDEEPTEEDTLDS